MSTLKPEHQPGVRAISPQTLGRGDRVPQFVVRSIDGGRIDYTEIWQRYNLMLVTLPDTGAAAYRRWLDRHMSTIRALDARCVVTTEVIPGLPHPGAVIADRWGEIVFAACATGEDDLPDPGELVAWLQFVASQCPECEGEAR